MDNKEIAQSFELLGDLMELHGENEFKVRSYHSAYRNLKTWETPISSMTDDEIAAIPGVGKAILGKIKELTTKGKMDTLERYKIQTPVGVQEMLQIKGFGPKKIRTIWRDLQVETVGELLYAINENRLIELKGFGKKTQEDLKQKLEYHQQSAHQFHYASVESVAFEILEELKALLPNAKIEFTGAIHRKMPILENIEILIGTDENVFDTINSNFEVIEDKKSSILFVKKLQNIPIKSYLCDINNFRYRHLIYTGSSEFVSSVFRESNESNSFSDEEVQLFTNLGLPFIPAECREYAWNQNLTDILPFLIQESDLKGVLHTHTTYSDGINTLEDLAKYVKSLGYQYLGITDHSKSAFYANGLKEGRLVQQWEEIDQLNKKLAPFKIFKGIESDILGDGKLDYEEDMLKQFDFIIASIHSHLKMDESKATQRLIHAIENPYTTMLGHPTGRLLLSRAAYPIDHAKVIDACAANGVAIELNANPYRLDLDWQWIPSALEKGVFISINPDAHSKKGVHDMKFGTFAARKGMLTKHYCLNAMSLSEFEAWLKK